MNYLIEATVEYKHRIKLRVPCFIDPKHVEFVRNNQKHIFRHAQVVTNENELQNKLCVMVDGDTFDNFKCRFEPDNDGIDHINVYSVGRTAVGRFASNFAHTPMTHPVHGKFECIEGFWHWLKTGSKHDQFRWHRGAANKVIGKWYSRVEVPGFENLVREMINYKYQQNPEQLKALRETTLPLVHYYMFKDFCVVPKDNHWVISHLMDIRDGIVQL